MSRKPLIGIGPHYIQTPSKRTMIGVYQAYLQSIESAGGRAIVLPPFSDQIPFFLQMVDGILLTGGDDIHPKYFGEKKLPVRMKLSTDERTEFEIQLVQQGYRLNVPVLGICLGAQTLNVAMGGKLFQDIRKAAPKSLNHRKGKHPIIVKKDSLLFDIIKQTQVSVNTRHHQAISEPARTLSVSAWSKDHIIEAVESDRKAFFLGIQWHPEEIPAQKISKRLFRAFISCSRKR